MATSTTTSSLPNESLVIKRSDTYVDRTDTLPFYASDFSHMKIKDEIPEKGYPARFCFMEIQDQHRLDFDTSLNTSSYVNVVMEPEEEQVAVMGLKINLADQTVYPNSYKLHDRVVASIAKLWNCPEPKGDETYAGAGTVGSTEACLLAGLCLKFRWRAWYQQRHQKSADEVLGIRPNLIISTLYQAAWEKLFKYMDIEPIFTECVSDSFKMIPSQLKDLINEKTIGVVCIMGNHYGGQYDPVEEVNKVIEEVNKINGFQVGIHVDAASGGFIAPFQSGLPPWDFRLNNVLSISSSGHKFGAAACGTGWVVWRQRKGLSEHVAINVSYLGGSADSYTLNFSRPASGVYTQFYKFMRMGMFGYRNVTENMMRVAAYIRKALGEMVHTLEDKSTVPVFQLLDDGDSGCLPVVTAMLNPEAKKEYDDVDLQYTISRHHWYVSAYTMKFEDPLTKEEKPLFKDQPLTKTMFRIVVKANLSIRMANNLIETFKDSIKFLDLHHAGFVHLNPAKDCKVIAHSHC